MRVGTPIPDHGPYGMKAGATKAALFSAHLLQLLADDLALRWVQRSLQAPSIV